jgi:hypothetical protein
MRAGVDRYELGSVRKQTNDLVGSPTLPRRSQAAYGRGSLWHQPEDHDLRVVLTTGQDVNCAIGT